MIHQKGFAFADAAIADDPDLDAAVQLHRGTVIEIRVASAAAFPLAPDSAERLALQDQIDDLVAGMRLRAEALGVALDDLFRLVNADLAAKPPKAGHAHKPIGDYERALLDESTRAHAAERGAHEALTRAQLAVRAATDMRLAADRACAGYFAGWGAKWTDRPKHARCVR